MKTRGIVRNEKGFTLLEVMIAATIFAIGLLAVAKMQIISIQGNRFARGATEGSFVVQSKIEELKNLPLTHAFLQDGDADGMGGINDVGANADGTQTVALSGITYTVSWNVSIDAPVPGARLVRVISQWLDPQLGQRQFSLDYLKATSSF